MKHKIKLIIFVLFIMAIMFFGIREVNYSNYEIIDGGIKEVVVVNFRGDKTEINAFGETLILNEYLSSKINGIIKYLGN